MKKLVVLICITTLALQAKAQLKPTKLSVFSNGTFYQKSEGQLKFTNNRASIDLPGTILYGTFWLAGENTAKVKQIDVSIDTIKKIKQSQFIDDFLVGNEGKNMTLRFTQPAISGVSTLRTITGSLLNFNSQTGLIKFKTLDGKVLIINTDKLNDIDLDAGANETFKDDTLIRRAKIILDKPLAEASFNQVSMQTGLQWQPSYFIKLENDKDARIIMKATVENGTEVDYNNIDLDLVVGSPQLYFGSKTDPVSDFYIPVPYGGTGAYSYAWDAQGESTINTRGARDGSFRREYRKGDAINYLDGDYDGKILYTEPVTGGVPAMYGNVSSGIISLPSLEAVDFERYDITADKDYSSEGKKSADLYYYHAGKVSIPKGAKTLLPISQSSINYKHVYEATIGDINNYAANKSIIVEEQKIIDVFHSLKLTNKTNAPFTEAPVFVVNENEDPIAQDLLKYTPINEETSIKLAKAIDVSVKTKEVEQSKDEKAKKINRKSYDKVVLKGTLDVANYLDKPITLTLKKALRGEVTKPDGGTVIKPGKFLAVNPVSLIKWDVELKAGEKKTIVYEYEVYVAP